MFFLTKEKYNLNTRKTDICEFGFKAGLEANSDVHEPR